MTDQPNQTPDPGAFEGASPAPARTNSPAPAARTSPPGQAEIDASGQRRWNAPRGREGDEIAAWEQSQRDRHTNKPAAQQATPDQASKPGDAAAADKTLKVGNTTVTEAELQEYLASKGARESGRLQAPDSPDGYKIELPASFKPPEGVDVAFDEANPAFGQLRAWAHSNGIPQSAFADLLGIYGGVRAGELSLGKMAHDTEVGKLGAAGSQRIDSLAMWMRGLLGDKGAVLTGSRGPDGQVRNGVLWTKDIVEAFEALQHRFSSQGASGYTGNGRDMGDHNSGKIPGYDKMSFAERRFAQDQIAARRPGR
jgi:hypothetical protein